MKPSRAAHLVILALVQASIINARSEARDQIHRVFGVHNPIINTHAHKINSDSYFDITFALAGNDQAFKLILEPNRNILGKDALVQVLDGQGNVRDSRPIDRQEYKVFKGSAWVPEPSGNWQRAGWARICVKRDGDSPLLEGVFSVWGDHHHIQPRSSYLRIKRDVDFDPVEITKERMVVYRDSDMVSAGERKRDSVISRCPADELSFNSGPDNPIFGRPEPRISWNSASLGSLANRQIFTGDTSVFENLRDTIGSTDGCPTSGRVALIGIATDCSYTAAFESTAAVRDNLIAMVNAASDVYERTFNITLGLQNLTISDAACPATAADSAPWNAACPTNGVIESTLESFSQWRGERNDNNAYWTMMTSCGYGGTVGSAWLGQLCVSSLRGSGGQSVTGANVVVRSPGEWQVFAHETAHVFGAVHDCNAGQCQLSESLQQCCPVSPSGCDAGAQYLMNPRSSRTMTDFSPCTIGNICSGLGSNMVRSRCLVDNVDLPSLNGAECGDGLVEAGEQCDCGSEEECGANSCCNPTTCQYRDNAVCDDAHEACCSGCQFASSGTVCRASKGSCDIEETCTGSAGTCPTDAYQPNGDSCGDNGGLFCAEGQCTSRDLQCTSINFTSACDADSCQLRCSPRVNSQFCVDMTSDLLDGTPCDGGSCSRGICSSNDSSSGNGSSSSSSWVDRNRNLVIGLATGLGSLTLLLLACAILSCCRKSKRSKALSMPPQPMGQQSHGPPPAYSAPAFVDRRSNPPIHRYA